MKNKYFRLGFAVILFLLAWFLRFRGAVGRAPFDWDQNRDYGEVRKIVSGHYVPLGPVAKGVGGFYLGSLYYYLLVPSYLAMQGNLRALPYTSIMIDALTAAAVFLVLSRLVPRKVAVATSLLWCLSWFLIEASRVSWNVALVPVWSLFVIYFMVSQITNPDRRYLYGLGLMAGLAFHIHVSAIPLVPLLIFIFRRSFKFGLRDWGIALGCLLAPLLTLIFYDLTHSFANLRLVKTMFIAQAANKVSPFAMIHMVLLKLGKTSSGLIISRFADNLPAGIFIFALAAASVFRKDAYRRVSGWMILITFSLVLLLHDIGFPEYYFSVAYLAIAILVIDFLFSWKALGIVALVFLIFLNVRQYTEEPTLSGLGVKEQVVRSLLELPQPLDIRYDTRSHRDGGFGYLLDLQGVKSVPGSKNKVVITDLPDFPQYIDGELSTDKFRAGFFKTSLYVVQ